MKYRVVYRNNRDGAPARSVEAANRDIAERLGTDNFTANHVYSDPEKSVLIVDTHGIKLHPLNPSTLNWVMMDQETQPPPTKFRARVSRDTSGSQMPPSAGFIADDVDEEDERDIPEDKFKAKAMGKDNSLPDSVDEKDNRSLWEQFTGPPIGKKRKGSI